MDIALRDKVFDTISKVLEVPVDEIELTSSPDTLASWDSLKHMNLILALEEEFGVMFDDDQIVNMVKVDLILEKTAGQLE